MLDKITSVVDNYQGKIKNPFIGTIVGVWLIHNWRIPYALFNFDKECTMQDKINFITDYFNKQNFWYEVLIVVAISLLALLITFLLMAISRGITDLYYKIVEPFMITRIDKNAIFTKKDKTISDNKIIELEATLNSKREEVTRTESNNQIISLKRDKVQNDFNTYIETSSQELKHLQKKMDDLVKKYKLVEKLTDHYDNLIHLLTEDEIHAINYILESNEDLVYDSLKNKFIENGFIEKKGELNKINYTGRFFLEYYKYSKLKIEL